MKHAFFAFLVFCMTGLAAQAQEWTPDASASKRDLSGFHGIDVSNGIVLVLIASDKEEVYVSASDNEYRDKISTTVEGGVLTIKYSIQINKHKKEERNLKAWVYYKQLDMLTVSTGALLKWQNELKAASMKIKANTGAIVNGAVDIADLDVNQDTGSIITLTGTAIKLSVQGDTGSIFKGADLTTQNCSATASTGAGVYITVNKELNVKANTGGFIKYKGEGGIREVKTHTGGRVSRI